MPKPKVVTVKVPMSASTFNWLRELAYAQSNTELHPGTVTAEELLSQAAFCFADYAGRREGSWEADVGRSMLVASGFHKHIPLSKQGQLLQVEDRENAKARARAEKVLANHGFKPVEAANAS